MPKKAKYSAEKVANALERFTAVLGDIDVKRYADTLDCTTTSSAVLRFIGRFRSSPCSFEFPDELSLRRARALLVRCKLDVETALDKYFNKVHSRFSRQPFKLNAL